MDPLRSVTCRIERRSITATTLGRSLKFRMAEATRNLGQRTNRGLMHQTTGKRRGKRYTTAKSAARLAVRGPRPALQSSFVSGAEGNYAV
jgi:hypothetical protein